MMIQSWQTHKFRKILLIAGATALSAVTVAACSTTRAPEPEQGSEETQPTAVSSDLPTPEQNVIATGTFVGKSDHETTGRVSILESNGQYIIKLADDFSLDGAPDPKVGLGKDGYDPATNAGALSKLKGTSTYNLAEGIKIDDYNEVYIWCEKFDVPLGVAKLES